MIVYKARHAKPLVDWRRFRELLAMAGISAAFMALLLAVWLVSPL